MALEPGTQVEAEGRKLGEQIAPLLPLLRRGLVLVLFFGGFASLTACPKTPVQRAEADIASVRKEVDAKTLVERGKAFAAVGDHTRAEEYLASGIDAGADPREVLPLLFDVCVRTGRYRSAIQHGENHLRRHPHDLETRVMVGALYTAINDGKQARVHLEHVVGKIDPNDKYDDVPLDGGMAPTTHQLAQQRDASAESREAGPRLRAQAHYLLAVVSRDADNDPLETDRHFREYLRLEPNGQHAEEAKASLLKRVKEQ
jgi:tetratricopeptide (TPR) repeat protein